MRVYHERLEADIERARSKSSSTQGADMSHLQKYLDELGPESFYGDELGIKGMYPDNTDGLMFLYKDMFVDFLRIEGIEDATKSLLEFQRARLHEHPRIDGYKDALTRKQWDAIFAAILHERKKQKR